MVWLHRSAGLSTHQPSSLEFIGDLGRSRPNELAVATTYHTPPSICISPPHTCAPVVMSKRASRPNATRRCMYMGVTTVLAVREVEARKAPERSTWPVVYADPVVLMAVPRYCREERSEARVVTRTASAPSASGTRSSPHRSRSASAANAIKRSSARSKKSLAPASLAPHATRHRRSQGAIGWWRLPGRPQRAC